MIPYCIPLCHDSLLLLAFSLLSDRTYHTPKTGEAFLQVRKSKVPGVSNFDTGNGLFTIKDIPNGAWVTSYTQTAPFVTATNEIRASSDYILVFQSRGKKVQVDGSKCHLGLGRIIQDGSFPLCLAPEKYSAVIKKRINVKWFLRGEEIWFKSLRDIKAEEELLTVYSEDNSYWTGEFSQETMSGLRQAFLDEPSDSFEKAEDIIRHFQL